VLDDAPIFLIHLGWQMSQLATRNLKSLDRKKEKCSVTQVN
jgi:hypothetical protein